MPQNESKNCLSLVVLAGGHGTRLKSVIGKNPKILTKVFGQVFLKFLIKWAILQNFQNIYVLVSHSKLEIEKFCAKHGNAIEIKVVSEGEIPIGTGFALRKFASEELGENQDVAIVYGDSLLPLWVNDMYKIFIKNNRKKVIISCVFTYNNGDSPNVVINDENLIIKHDSNIIDVDEEPYDGELAVEGGLTILSSRHLLGFRHADLQSCVNELVKSKEVIGYRATEKYIEFGNIDSYAIVANMNLTNLPKSHDWMQSNENSEEKSVN